MQILKQSLFEKTLVIIVKIGLYASLLMPFVVTNFTLYPYVFGKAMFFQFVIEIIFPFWAVLIALYPAYRPSFSRNFKSANIINTLIGVWAFSLIVTTITSANQARSFWGSQERMMGVFTLLHFIAMYYIFVSVMRTKRAAARFLCGVCGVGIATVFYLHYEWLRDLGERTSGMFGNPGIAGSFLLFLAFFIPILFLMANSLKTFRRRYLVIGGITFEFLTLAAILFNQTRAVWMGLFFSLLVGLWFIPARLKRLRKRGYIGVGILCFGAAIFAVMVFTDRMPKQVYSIAPLLERVRNLNDSSRLFVWRAGLRSFPDRPIFGYGPGNFSIPFNKQYDPVVATFIASYIGPRLNFDQAHNQPLEYLVTTGVVGFAAYVALTIGSLFLLWKGRKRAVNIAALLLLISYITHSFFTFDTPSSFLFLIVSLWIVYQSCSDPPALRKEKIAPQSASFVIICATVFPITLLLIILNVKSILASRSALIALAAVNQKTDVATQVYFYKKALDHHSPYSFDLAEGIGDDLLDGIEGYSPELEAMAPIFIKELEKYSENDWHRLFLIARLYEFLCQKDTANCVSALTYLERAKMIAPNRFQIYAEMYAVYNNIGELKKAREALERAVELGYSPASVPVLINLGFLYGSVGEYQKSLQYYEQALKLDPTNSDVLSSIIMVLAESGDITKAREYAEDLFIIDPSQKPSIEKFLNDKAK